MKKLLSICRAKGLSELNSGGEKAGYIFWNIFVLVFSSAVIAFISLTLAFGTYDYQMFRDYFARPLLLLLNYLPVLLLQLIMFALFGRQWTAYLITALIVIGFSAGDFYKLKFRNEPFVFSELGFIKTGIAVAGNYDMTPGPRIIIAAAAVVFGTLFIFLLARGRAKLKYRAALLILSVVAAVPLWTEVYSSSALYKSPKVVTDSIMLTREFCSKGFVYPFIYSASEDTSGRPEGYDEKLAASVIAEYSDSDIPEDRRVNIIAFQLESFTDFRTLGIDGIADFVYSSYDEIRNEAVTGNMVVNIIGGGTVETEHSVLTGEYNYRNVTKKYPSYVQYMNEQGYVTSGCHPNSKTTYNRVNRNGYLGFDSYRFLEDGFEELTADLYPSAWFSDCVLFPEVLRQFREITANGDNAFLFNVTMQGHSPYNTEEHQFPEQCFTGDCSQETDCFLNNYLGSVMRTQTAMKEFLDELRSDSEPVVVLLYGDHKPSFGEGNSVAEELGINCDTGTKEGLYNFYATEYLIWANDAAKELVGKDFTGTGPDISPFGMFPTLFSYIGWEGSASNAYLTDFIKQLPILSAKGYYMENGEITHSLSAEGKQLANELKGVQYYLRTHYK